MKWLFARIYAWQYFMAKHRVDYRYLRASHANDFGVSDFWKEYGDLNTAFDKYPPWVQDALRARWSRDLERAMGGHW